MLHNRNFLAKTHKINSQSAPKFKMKEDKSISETDNSIPRPNPPADPNQEHERKISRLKKASISIAYLYLIYQVVIVVCLTVYYYYRLGMYLPLAFGITIFICYLRSLTAFIALRLAHLNTREAAQKNWKELRDWFYWSIALMILGVVIIMGIIPLRISQLVNINLQNLLIINGVDFVIFIAMGSVTICFCNLLLKDVH